MRILLFCFGTYLLIFSLSSFAQSRSGQGTAKELYLEFCSTCHGKSLEGGLGSSLNDGSFKFGASDAEIATNIAKGIAEGGMPGWEKQLDENQIRSLVILIREEEKLALKAASKAELKLDSPISTQHHNFKLEVHGETEGLMWGLDFLPDGAIVATERAGRLWLFKDGKKIGPIANTPKVLAQWQGGLLDVRVHPDYEKNRWIYLSFSEKSEQGSMTTIVRGRIRDGNWVDEQSIFRVPQEMHVGTGHHYGSRIEFVDEYMYFSVGDRGQRHHPQDLSQPAGKIHRLYHDGRIPKDNPFVNTEGAYPSIWSYGHRNPQGMDIHPETKKVWAAEHGPRGGDEVNLIEKANNYGWPLATYGMNYDGTAITNVREKPGFVSPKIYWTPSISPGGIQFYEGKQFPRWKNSLLVGGMGSTEMHRLEFKGDEVVSDEILFSGLGRIRDIAVDSKGYIWILLNTRDPESGKLVRLIPIKSH